MLGAAAESVATAAATVQTDYFEMTLDFDNNLVPYMHHEFVACGLPLEYDVLAGNHRDDEVTPRNNSGIKYKCMHFTSK